MLQGVVLFCGSIIFLVIQKTELGGFEDAHNYWGNPANVAKPRVWNMQHVPNEVNQVRALRLKLRSIFARVGLD